LRWSEIVGLRARHIDSTGVDVVAQYVNGRWEEPKGGARRRVPLPASVVELVDIPDDPDSLVFTSPRGGPLVHSNWRRRVWVPAKDKAGVDPEFRFHDLRHTAVALAIATGANPKMVQQRFGHSSITVTYDTYGHLFNSEDDPVVAGLDEMRRKATSKRLRAV
jgi:integrase